MYKSNCPETVRGRDSEVSLEVIPRNPYKRIVVYRIIA